MRNDEWAVSDVLGNVLLIGITVTSFAALTFMVGQIPPPPDQVHAELSVEVQAGPDQSWSTGDELIVINHLYGESVPADESYVLLGINGATQRFSGAQLDFSGGLLDIGETWKRTALVGFNDEVSVDIGVLRSGGSTLLTSTRIITGESNCASDNDPPHAIINQEPTNLEALTGTDPLIVTALLVDICSNVDGLNDPLFEYWFNTETHQSVVMTPLGGDTWRVELPAPNGDWLTRAGSTFSYTIALMADSLGNVGSSPVIVDEVDPLPPDYYYVQNKTAILGGITSFPNMQNGTDVGAVATLSEGIAAGGSTITRLYPNAESTVVPNTNPIWDKSADIIGNDMGQSKYKDPADPSVNPIRAVFEDVAPSTDQITNLKVVLVGQTGPDNPLANNDDGWRLQVCWTNTPITGSTCSQKSGILTPAFPATPDMEAEVAYDITDRRPGGGSWKWDDLNNLDVLLAGQIVGGIRDGTWLASTVRLEVTHGPGYDMSHEFNWENQLIPTTGNLEILYYTNAGEFEVFVWDWMFSEWNPRATALDAIASTPWSTPITSNEWNNGNVRVRIDSLGTDPAKQAAIHVDFMRLAV